MSVLYVTQPGAEIHKNGDRLIVQYQKEALTAIPLRDVERVVLQQDVSLNAEAQSRLASIRGVCLLPAGSSGGDVHCSDNGAVGGGAPGRRVGDPVVAKDHPAA